jgi:hypothetical protein
MFGKKVKFAVAVTSLVLKLNWLDPVTLNLFQGSHPFSDAETPPAKSAGRKFRMTLRQ